MATGGLPTFGLALKNFVGPSERPDIDALYAYAERAEALGFDSLWAWDHVILGVEPAFPILDAVGTLTAIAARTSRIKLGTGVLVLPLRNPTVAAKALGTLDAISKGRLILGVAAGWYAREFDAVGVPFKRRGRLFERNLEILTRLWTEERVTLQVDELNLRDAVMLPRPVQRPPILIGGYVDAVLRRVATRGDGWLTYFYTPQSYRRSWEKIVGFAREAGRDPSTLTGTNQLAIYVGRSREATEAPMRRWLETEWDVAAWSESTIEHAIRGSVDECVEQLRAHTESGVDRIILIPYRYEPEQVELIAREIVPRLTQATDRGAPRVPRGASEPPMGGHGGPLEAPPMTNQTFERALAPEPGRTALVVVDMQRGFLDPGEAMEVPPARATVPVIRGLLELFRAKRLPIVFTEFVYSESAPLLVGTLHPEHQPAPPGAPRGFGLPSSSCLEGTPSADTVSDLAPRPGEPVVRKRGYDAFAGTPLDSALRARGVTSLVVTGTMTDICVLATVIGAFHREYRVTVVEDGVATLWPEIQRAALDIVGRAYGRVVTAKEVADQISRW